MLTRRFLMSATVAAVSLLAVSRFVPVARAQSAGDAKAFIEQTTARILAVINSAAPTVQKQQQLTAIIDQTVDVADIARFCLGRFWRTATPEQQQQYLDLFHRVLMLNITGKIGEYEGVKVSIGQAVARDDGIAVTSSVTRPGNEPARVDWIVGGTPGAPKIIDVVAEGTSLRLTQRQDYGSYLSRNGNSVQALIDAMKRQAQAANTG